MSEIYKSFQYENCSQSIDLRAAAQVVQRSREASGGIKLIAPAKINLFLAVEPRENVSIAYHNVATVLHTLALHDTLFMRRATSHDSEIVSLTCDVHGGVEPLVIPAEQNLAFRAVEFLAREITNSAPCAEESNGELALCPLVIHIDKYIPHAAGLGGGSADAAAALVGAATLWGLSPTDSVVVRVAQQLGSDVPFFLYGGCAFMDGRGDTFVRSLVPMKKSLVLIKPPESVSTAAAYARFDENPVAIDDQCHFYARDASCAQDVPLMNNLSNAAECLVPKLQGIREWISSQPGVETTLLCGSGSAYCAFTKDFAASCALACAAQARGLWARTTSCASLRACCIPQDS